MTVKQLKAETEQEKRKIIEMTNSFHGTRAAVLAIPYPGGQPGEYLVQRRAMARALRQLCPTRGGGCQCGGIFGKQPVGGVDYLCEDANGDEIITLKAYEGPLMPDQEA